ETGKAGIVANTGDFSAPAGGINAQDQGVATEFQTSAVDFTDNRFDVANHGFSAGQEVIYTGETLPVGGLVTGQHYFVAMIDANHFALATTRAAALSGNPSQWVHLTDTGIDPAAGHVIQTVNNTGVPTINNQAFNDPTLAEKRERTPVTATQSG